MWLCDPAKNTECTKKACYIHGGPCYRTTKEAYKMENEMRYYLGQMLACMEHDEATEDVYEAKYLVTAVRLPNGAIELAVNTESLVDKVRYILEAYDDNMRLKTNPSISMQNVMVV